MPRSHSLIAHRDNSFVCCQWPPAWLGYLNRPTTRLTKRLPDVTGQTLLVWQLAAIEVENNSRHGLPQHLWPRDTGGVQHFM